MKSSGIYKRVLFYSAAVVAPFVIWFFLEFLANSITHRFDPLKIDRKKKSLYLNQDYFNDYFIAEQEHFFNTSSSNRAIHLEKKNRLRIFCLGGSTTAGYPYNTLPEYNCPASFPNYLRAILQYNTNLPEVEMLNLGSNAFNSLSILKLFEDVKKYDPDLLIIYSGHNEYFGPNEFALTGYPNRVLHNKRVHDLFLRLRQTYLYQGLRWLVKQINKKGLVELKDYARWSLKNTLAVDDPYHQVVHDNYSQNLTALVRMAKQQGISVVLCTPISNLTFPPFVSRFSQPLNRVQAAQWDTLLTRTSLLFEQKHYQDALKVWKNLYDLDSSYADVHFSVGMNYAMLNQYQIAAQALTRANDLDALPFRARSYVQETCRRIARTENVILADTDLFFRQLSGKYYPEPSLLLDHVHPTEPGYFYLALFLARTLVMNGVFPGIRDIQYPSLEETRQVLNIYDFVAYKVEFDFTQQSYLAQLSQLNPAIKKVLLDIRESAIRQAKAKGQELYKEQKALEEKEKN